MCGCSIESDRNRFSRKYNCVVDTFCYDILCYYASTRNSKSFQAKWYTVVSNRVFCLDNRLCKRVDEFLFPTNARGPRAVDERSLELEGVIRATRRRAIHV